MPRFSTAIAAIERGGTWKMSVRGNTKAELISLEQQRTTLSRPAPPRPAKTVREALRAERFPTAAQDHERLSLRAAKLRWHLVEAPIGATSAPLRFGALSKT
jgi:hypothetical protein